MNDQQTTIQPNSQGVTEHIPPGFGTVDHNLTDLRPASSEVGFLWNNFILLWWLGLNKGFFVEIFQIVK